MDEKIILKILSVFIKAQKPLLLRNDELSFLASDRSELYLEILAEDYGFVRMYSNSKECYRITAKGIEQYKYLKRKLRPIGFNN